MHYNYVKTASPYDGLSLKDFLSTVLKAYPDVTQGLDKLTDSSTQEYLAFHEKSTKEHVSILHVRQRGVTYFLNRLSNIKGTAGYERYMYAVDTECPNSTDEVNIAVRFFRATWDEWFTIRLTA